MRLLLTIIVFLTSFLGSAQNWNLVNPERQLHYSIDTTVWYDATVLVDSISTNGADSIFHLNRIVTECDSCPNDWQFHYLRYNQPTFMQRVAVKNGDSWNLRSPNSFGILPHAQLNQTWLFDTLNNVTAEVTEAMGATVLGVSDSIKTISLSSGDSIMISKNFGIIDMGNQSNRWHLVGAELPDTVHGFKLPGFDEFYNFQVGDEYQYEFHAGHSGNDWQEFGVFRRVITSIFSSEDSIAVNYDLISSDTPYWVNGDPSNQLSGILYLVRDQDPLIAAYNNKLIYTDYDFNPFSPYRYAKARISLDSLGRVCKTEGTDEFYQEDRTLYMIIDSIEYILQHEIWTTAHLYHRKFTEGLGKTVYSFAEFESGAYDRLVGYIKSGDTTGNIIDGIVEFEYHEVSTFPNPAATRIWGLMQHQSIQSMEIIGIEGKTHRPTWTSNSTYFEVDVSELKPGLYLLRVITENGTSVSRFIKQ